MQNPIRFDPFTYLDFTIWTSGGVLVADVWHAIARAPRVDILHGSTKMGDKLSPCVGMILANNQENNQGMWSITPLSRWCLIREPKTNVVLVPSSLALYNKRGGYFYSY
jgi:hypothetical protein